MRIGQIAIDIAPLRESRDYRRLFAGRFVSMAGNAVATTAANWQVYGLTHDSLAVGLLTLRPAPACSSACLTAGCWPTGTTGASSSWRSSCRRPCWPRC